jgi:hypothetical protein
MVAQNHQASPWPKPLTCQLYSESQAQSSFIKKTDMLANLHLLDPHLLSFNPDFGYLKSVSPLTISCPFLYFHAISSPIRDWSKEKEL